MSNTFRGVGNIGQAPVLRNVQVNGESRPVADMRVYFDRSVPKGDGFEDEGGFWLTVALWGSRAETAVKVLTKGARICVVGQLRQENWQDDEGAERSALRLTASEISIDPLCVETVAYRPRSSRNQEEVVEDDAAY